MVIAGVAALLAAALGVGPEWLDGVGAVAVATVLSWALAVRTGGRPWVTAVLALAIGSTAVVVDTAMLRTGAAVLTVVTGGVLAVMLTVPAATYLRACREVLVATVISGITALAAVGLEPTVTVPRFDYASLLLGLVLVFALVYRLGAGLHGLGRRGLVAVLVGAVLLVLTLAYAELLRRYGAGSVVQSALDFVDWTTERIGAFPRPLVVLLGIPALVWGTPHARPAPPGLVGLRLRRDGHDPAGRRACSTRTAASWRPACRRRTRSSPACCSATSSCARTSRSPARAGGADVARRRPRRTVPSLTARRTLTTPQ